MSGHGAYTRSAAHPSGLFRRLVEILSPKWLIPIRKCPESTKQCEW